MEANLKLKAPSTIIVTGSSNCGKTVLIEKIVLSSKDVFEKGFDIVHWVHARHAADVKMFDRIKNELEKQKIALTFHDGYPEDEVLSNKLFEPKEAHKALILDDIFTTPTANKSLCDLFNIHSHHSNG